MIAFQHPGLPPTTNKAYFNLPRGGRSLTTIGRKYKTETTAYFAQKYRRELLTFQKEAPYMVLLRFYLESVENKGWPDSAQTRYKRSDVTNRVKLLEDVLKDVTGVDDSNNLTVILQKLQSQEERVEIWFWNLESEGTPFDAALRDLHV